MFVKDRMTPDPITGFPEMSVTDAQDLMKSRGFRHLPILDETGKMVGLITKGSLASALPADTSNLSLFEVSYVLAKIKVRDVMATDLITVDQNTAVEEAARVMFGNTIRSFSRARSTRNREHGRSGCGARAFCTFSNNDWRWEGHRQ